MGWREQVARALLAQRGPARLVPRSTDPNSLMSIYQQAGKVDDVPVEWLRQLPGNDLRHSNSWVSGLGRDITSEGLNNPLMISVGKDSGTAILGEGNHRLQALLGEGYTHAPVWTNVGHRWGAGRGADVRDDLFPKPGEYFRSEARPSDVFMSLRDYLGTK